METLSIIFAALACLSVLAVLAIGLGGFVKGGQFNEQNGNKLMRLRVLLQGVALAFLALAYLTSKG